MPVEWPSEKRFGWRSCLLAVAAEARGLGLNIGRAGDDAKAGEASARDSFVTLVVAGGAGTIFAQVDEVKVG